VGLSEQEERCSVPPSFLGGDFLLGHLDGTLVIGLSVLELLSLLNLSQESAGCLVFRVGHIYFKGVSCALLTAERSSFA